MNIDVDSRLKADIDELVGKMRAKRLSSELPVPAESMAPPAEEGTDDSGDQLALESMLDSE